MKMEGIITPIVTPFHRDAEESINYEATKHLIDHLIDHGVKGIFILGSNGEFHVLSEEEKVAYAKAVIDIVDHRVPRIAYFFDKGKAVFKRIYQMIARTRYLCFFIERLHR